MHNLLNEDKVDFKTTKVQEKLIYIWKCLRQDSGEGNSEMAYYIFRLCLASYVRKYTASDRQI